MKAKMSNISPCNAIVATIGNLAGRIWNTPATAQSDSNIAIPAKALSRMFIGLEILDRCRSNQRSRLEACEANPNYPRSKDQPSPSFVDRGHEEERLIQSSMGVENR